MFCCFAFLTSSKYKRNSRQRPWDLRKQWSLDCEDMTNDLLNTLNVRIIGQGDLYLVLAHGFGTDQSAWQKMLPFFMPHYRIVLYDLVCAGTVNPSHFDFGRYSTLDGYVDDLMYIIDSLHINRCVYIGHSISAMIGILAAIRRPHLFTKLILVSASPRFFNDEDYDCGFDQEEIEEVFKAMESNYAAWANGYAPLAVGSDVPAVIREFSRTLFNMRPDISLHVLRTVFSSDLRGILGMVRVPCCIVQTAHDVSLPSSAATYLRNHLGGHCTVELLNTEGHLPHLTAPGQLARVLRRVLRLL